MPPPTPGRVTVATEVDDEYSVTGIPPEFVSVTSHADEPVKPGKSLFVNVREAVAPAPVNVNAPVKPTAVFGATGVGIFVAFAAASNAAFCVAFKPVKFRAFAITATVPNDPANAGAPVGIGAVVLWAS